MSNKRHAQYREAAKRLVAQMVHNRDLRVTSISHVHEVEDGAFVEVQLWVPRAQADLEAGDSQDVKFPEKR